MGDGVTINVKFLDHDVAVAGFCSEPADPTGDIAVAGASGEQVEELEGRGEVDWCASGYDLDPTRRGRTAGPGP